MYHTKYFNRELGGGELRWCWDGTGVVELAGGLERCWKMAAMVGVDLGFARLKMRGRSVYLSKNKIFKLGWFVPRYWGVLRPSWFAFRSSSSSRHLPQWKLLYCP